MTNAFSRDIGITRSECNLTNSWTVVKKSGYVQMLGLNLMDYAPCVKEVT